MHSIDEPQHLWTMQDVYQRTFIRRGPSDPGRANRFVASRERHPFTPALRVAARHAPALQRSLHAVQRFFKK
jgi:hypothetical protein